MLYAEQVYRQLVSSYKKEADTSRRRRLLISSQMRIIFVTVALKYFIFVMSIIN
jgi:hypothetical protein